MSKISSKELFVFTFFISVILFPGFGNTYILELGKHSCLISSVLGFIIGFIPLLMIIYMIDKTNDKNIFSYNKNNFKILGIIINIFYLITIIYVIFVETWTTVNFTISQFLSRTSYYLIMFFLASCIAFVIIKHLEVIGRCHVILFIIFMLVILFAWMFLIPLVEFNNYLPIFDVSYKDFIHSIFIYPPFVIVPLISLLAIKKTEIVDSKNIKKGILLGYTCGFIFYLIFLILIIGVFGINLSIVFTYPEYALFKKVNAFNFIQRIENILGSTITIAAFTSLAVLFYFITTYIKTTFNIKKNIIFNIIVIIICFTILIISITICKTYIVINLFTKYYLYSSFIFIILFINFILIFIKSKFNKHLKM